MPGADLAGVHDWATLVEDLDYEPTRCVIVGGGKVAVEYGSFFQSTGCETTIVSRSPILRTGSLHHVDEDIRMLRPRWHAGARHDAARGRERRRDRGRRARRAGDRRARRRRVEAIDCDFVFNCTGERPNSEHAVRALGVATGPGGEILVDDRMRTSVEGVYATGDVIGAPMEMFKARKCGMTAARNVMGEDLHVRLHRVPRLPAHDLRGHVGGAERGGGPRRCDDVAVIRMPPKGQERDNPLPCAEGTMLYAFSKPELSGLQKCIIDATSRRVLGFHHVGYGAKDAFQYLDPCCAGPRG